MLNLFRLALAAQHGLEEEQAQDKEQDGGLQQDEPPQLSAPGHVPESFGIEIEYGDKGVFHVSL
jgi:hypothetical protein